MSSPDYEKMDGGSSESENGSDAGGDASTSVTPKPSAKKAKPKKTFGAKETKPDGSVFEYKKPLVDVDLGCNSKSGRWVMIKAPDTPCDLMKKSLQSNPSPAPIAGNLYKFFAFGMSESCYKSVGLMLVVFIQIFAPVVILCWALPQLQWERVTSESLTFDSFFKVDYGSDDKNLTAFMTRLLGFAFLLCFVMSGRECLLGEWSNWERVMNLLSFLQQHHMPHTTVKWHWLVIGPAVNTYIIVLICVDMLLLLLLAEGPKDVVFDALGLLFLWNLDDVGGDLGFMTEQDWNGDNLAIYYEENDIDDEADAAEDDNTKIWYQIGETFYWIGEILLAIFLVSLPTMYFLLQGLDLKQAE